jgi:hypothetical protein
MTLSEESVDQRVPRGGRGGLESIRTLRHSMQSRASISALYCPGPSASSGGNGLDCLNRSIRGLRRRRRCSLAHGCSDGARKKFGDDRTKIGAVRLSWPRLLRENASVVSRLNDGSGASHLPGPHRRSSGRRDERAFNAAMSKAEAALELSCFAYLCLPHRRNDTARLISSTRCFTSGGVPSPRPRTSRATLICRPRA